MVNCWCADKFTVRHEFPFFQAEGTGFYLLVEGSLIDKRFHVSDSVGACYDGIWFFGELCRRLGESEWRNPRCFNERSWNFWSRFRCEINVCVSEFSCWLWKALNPQLLLGFVCFGVCSFSVVQFKTPPHKHAPNSHRSITMHWSPFDLDKVLKVYSLFNWLS